MTYSAHLLTVAVVDGTTSGIALAPIAGEFTMDERRSPYVRARFTVVAPSSSDTLSLINARGGALQGTIRAHYSDPVTAAKVTAYAAATPVTPALLTALIGSDLLSDVTAELTSWSNAVPRDSSTIEYWMRIDRVQPLDGTLEIDISGGETRLQEYSYIEATAMTFAAGTGIRPMITTLLNILFNAPVLLPGVDAPLAEDLVWVGGVSPWDLIDTALQPLGLTLQCLPNREWQVIAANDTPATTVDLDRLTDIGVIDSRDGYADVVLVSYIWRDSLGDEQVRGDLAVSPAVASKVMVVEKRGVPYPGPGAAEKLLARALRQGVNVSPELVSDYAVRPGLGFSSSPPGQPFRSGRITAVEFQWPANRMRLTTQI